MVYKIHKNGSYNIHTIQTDRFKNIQIETIFRNNLNPQTVSKRTLLFDLLLEKNAIYKTKRDLILKQEEFYNTFVYNTTFKVGNEILTSVGVDMLNPKYMSENHLKEIIEFYFSIIFNPDVNNNEFDEITLNTIRTRLISDIKCIKENPSLYSTLEATRIALPDSISSVNVNGTIEDMEAITPSNLYEAYQDILAHDYIDIYVIGDFDEDEIVSYITEFMQINTIKNHKLDLYVQNKVRKKPKKVTDNSEYAQAQIVAIYNTDNLTDYERKYVAQIYNMILGGGSLETKLYRHLRDEHSLCYYVRSTYRKYDDLLMISTSVDNEQSALAVKLIKKSVEEMLNKVTDEEVNTAILSMISSINMSLDAPTKIIDEYLFMHISDLDDVETRIEQYRKVTKEEVMRVAKKIILNTIYVLESGGSDEN